MRSTRSLLSVEDGNDGRQHTFKLDENDQDTLKDEDSDDVDSDDVEKKEQPLPNYDDGFSFINYGTSVDKWLDEVC